MRINLLIDKIGEILKMCMYPSESNTCKFDKITVVSYLETYIRSGYSMILKVVHLKLCTEIILKYAFVF